MPNLSKQRQHPALIALAKAIRCARKARGISQEKLALAAGVDRSYMGRVERRDNNGPTIFSTYSATKHALEGYVQGLRYEVSPFGIDVVLVEPGPFGTSLLSSGQSPARLDVLKSYGELANVPTAVKEHFAQFLQSDEAPDPQLVVDSYLALVNMQTGKHPTRTVVGIPWGVDEMNAAKQPIQDRVLKEMLLEKVLRGISA